jgi:hypothetical protein
MRILLTKQVDCASIKVSFIKTKIIKKLVPQNDNSKYLANK